MLSYITILALTNLLVYHYRVHLKNPLKIEINLLNLAVDLLVGVVLEHITNLFAKLSVKGSVVTHTVSNVWEIRINGVKNCKGLFTYFDEYNLISKKV